MCGDGHGRNQRLLEAVLLPARGTGVSCALFTRIIFVANLPVGLTLSPGATSTGAAVG